MATKTEEIKKKFIPGSDDESNEIFTFPYTVDDSTIDYLQDHGRIMFIIRGPPGTAKDSLSQMLMERYSDATLCSADSYFSDTFSSAKRDTQSLRLSHEYCHSKVKTACMKNKHPIIVKNTHMKKFEMQKYLDFAAEYIYTVIMAVTIRKFEATPEILARSNTKGLGVEYFRRRLIQWQEVSPVMIGWFLGPQDSSCLKKECQAALDSLLGDGKFCRIMDAYDRGALFTQYNARKLLYCTAACGQNYRCNEIKSFYLSKKVQENYGQCFTITVIGYLVTPSFVTAVVHLNETMKNLRYITKNRRQHSENDMDSLLRGFSSLDVGDNLKNYSAVTTFNIEFSDFNSTAEHEDNSDKVINVNDCSFIMLAERGNESHPPIRAVDSFSELLIGAADVNGIIDSDKFIELSENVMVCRLPKAWFIRLNNGISFKSIFTGLYI